MLPKRYAPLALAAALALAAGPPVAAETKLLRFPDLAGDTLAFTYAGDLWRAPAAGGEATRLTRHPGVELFAKLSPDGEQIAFTGQYEGDEQVYVMPVAGGAPRQLTFYPARGPLPPRWGYDHQVLGWTPDGERVLFRTFRDHWDIGRGAVYSVPVDGGLPERLPMPTAGSGTMSPDGRHLFYSPRGRDFRSWKRYRGGWAQDLYLFDLESHELEQITDHPLTDRDPMWIDSPAAEGKLYFASDRGGRLNLYAYDRETKALEQLTHETEWDVRWPSADERGGRIVYELAGELHVYDLARGAAERISIRVPDDSLTRRPSRISAADQIEHAALSPKGERVLFVARGDVFTAPVENGPTRNLTRSSGAHDKWARWSPDGSSIVFISDMDGEEELWRIDPLGRDEPEQLTDGGTAMRYDPQFSPDGEHIAFSDKDGKLWVLTLAGGSVVEVADDPRGSIGAYSWSPGGGYLAFDMQNETGLSSIHVWSLADGQRRQVTSDLYNSFSATWDPEGNYLYYISDRTYVPQIGSWEFNYVVDRESDLYAMALRKDVPHPFPPESDEVTVEKEDEDGEAGEDGKGDKKGKKGKKDKDGETGEDGDDEDGFLTIDFEGLAERVARVPLEADNYAVVTAKKGHLIYAVTPAFFYGRPSHAPPSLHVFSLAERSSEKLADGLNFYWLSDDGEKILVGQGGGFTLYDANPQGAGSGKPISTAGLYVDRVPAEEWAEIYDEVWRRYRDFFYVPNMHGNDWEALGEQYRTLLPHVAHRSDLNYVLSELIAELDVSHAYVAGGDYEIPERPSVALPGARFSFDDRAGRYRIDTIFRGHNEEDRYRSPLTEIGVEAEEGDYLLAIDGHELERGDNPYRLLQHKADRPVELTLNASPALEGARRVSYRPVSSEQPLVYLDWVLTSYDRVQEASGGRVGYLHLPDMGANGIREFVKWFYPQLRRQGLVVDARGNGGGNVSAMIVDRLSRDLLGLTYDRRDDHADTYPTTVFDRPMACLLDENSGSDGDIFPHMFRQAGLGPLIGKRSWGGVIGIGGHGPLIDGGAVFVPESGQASPDGRWVLEGYGVDPDIEVDNDPASVIAGRDPQLERAIAEVLAAIEADPPQLPPKPRGPVRTLERYEGVVDR